MISIKHHVKVVAMVHIMMWHWARREGLIKEAGLSYFWWPKLLQGMWLAVDAIMMCISFHIYALFYVEMMQLA